MSERTTIGGTTYESLGSSSSNLLLKCNGTARIQWGSKFIDLIKNGKLAIGSGATSIFNIESVSDIKQDGVYVLNNTKSLELWVCNKGKHYQITGDALYVSASTKQDIPVDQQEQILSNIGIYYNTMEDVNNSGVKNGLVYVLENKTLYTIHNGIIEEFKALLKPDTDEKNNDNETINKPDTVTFVKGMVTLYSKSLPIPQGWAFCDGNSYTYKGEDITTPIVESPSDSLVYIIKL